MKFFTMAWWSGEDEQDRLAQYEAYCRQRPQLPPALVRLEREIALHDANLLRMEMKLAGELVLHLDQLDAEGARRPLRLRYVQATSVVMTSDPKVGLGGPHGFGDLGYDEIDVGDDGRFEHRILFSSGIELAVRFADLIVEQV